MLDLCSDQELNSQPFGVWEDTLKQLSHLARANFQVALILDLKRFPFLISIILYSDRLWFERGLNTEVVGCGGPVLSSNQAVGLLCSEL